MHQNSTKKEIHTKYIQAYNYFLNVGLTTFLIYITWPDISFLFNRPCCHSLLSLKHSIQNCGWKGNENRRWSNVTSTPCNLHYLSNILCGFFFITTFAALQEQPMSVYSFTGPVNDGKPENPGLEKAINKISVALLSIGGAVFSLSEKVDWWPSRRDSREQL